MRRLARKNLYTQDNSLEVRVEQLERRIIPGPPVYAFLRRTTSQTISPGIALIEWTHFETTDLNVFSTTISGVYPADNNASGDTLLKIKRDGIVHAHFELTWESGAFQRAAFMATSSGAPAVGNSPISLASSTDEDKGVIGLLDFANENFGSVEIMEFWASNGDGSDRDVLTANAFVTFWEAKPSAPSIY